jgi:hypothetical protein
VKHRAALALVALTLAPTIPLQAQGESPTPSARVRGWPACALASHEAAHFGLGLERVQQPR